MKIPQDVFPYFSSAYIIDRYLTIRIMLITDIFLIKSPLKLDIKAQYTYPITNILTIIFLFTKYLDRIIS